MQSCGTMLKILLQLIQDKAKNLNKFDLINICSFRKQARQNRDGISFRWLTIIHRWRHCWVGFYVTSLLRRSLDVIMYSTILIKWCLLLIGTILLAPKWILRGRVHQCCLVRLTHITNNFLQDHLRTIL